MAFFVTLLIYVALTILTELLRPKPQLEDAKAATFEEFQVPTTDPKRAIPIAWGRVRVQSSGIIWYGDYRPVAIVEEVRTGLWSSDDVIAGYHYFIGVQLGICRALDSIEGMDWDDERLIEFSPLDVPGDSGTLVTVNEPNFQGGDEGPAAGGGIVGNFRFYKSGPTQDSNGYLSLFQNPLPNYRHLAQLVLEGVNVGTQPAIKPISIIGRRYPNQLGLTGGNHIVGTGANPAAVIYELMIDDDFGLNIDPADIDVVGMREIGDALALELHSYSNLWVQKSTVKQVIDDILRQIDATLFLDFETGLFEMRLVRAVAAGSPALLLLNESNVVDVEDFNRTNWPETSNRVIVNWKNPNIPGNPSPAVQDDMANQRLQNRNVVATFNYVGIDNATLAAEVCARELRGLAFPLAKATLIVNRDAIALRPGDVFELQWADLNIESMNMRVLSIAVGDSVEARIRIDALQDVYGLGKVVYAPPGDTLWVNPAISDPLPTLADDCFEAPLMLDRSSPFVSPSTAETVQDSRIVLLPVANQNNVVSFRMMRSGPGSPTIPDTAVADYAVMCPSGILAQNIDKEDFLEGSPSPNSITLDTPTGISGMKSATEAQIEDELANLFRINDEFFSFESFTLNAGGTLSLIGIHRAKLDSLPTDHIASPSTRVFIMGLNTQFAGGITLARFTFNGAVSARPNTTRGRLETGDANACNFTSTNRIFLPAPPKNFQLGTATTSPIVAPGFFPASLSGLADWDLTWDNRDRRVLGDPDVNEDSSQPIETDTEVVLQFLSASLSPVLRREVVFGPGSPTEAYTYTVAEQNTDFGGPGSPESPNNQDVRVKLFSRRTAAPLSGSVSRHDWDFVVTRQLI